jgi:hypothetical protein
VISMTSRLSGPPPSWGIRELPIKLGETEHRGLVSGDHGESGERGTEPTGRPANTARIEESMNPQSVKSINSGRSPAPSLLNLC